MIVGKCFQVTLCFQLLSFSASLSTHISLSGMYSPKKYPYSPPPPTPNRRDWNVLVGGWVDFKTKTLKKCLKLNWNVQTVGGGGCLGKNPFHGGGMDIFRSTQYIDILAWSKGRYTRGSLLLKHTPETRSRVSTPTSTHEGPCS